MKVLFVCFILIHFYNNIHLKYQNKKHLNQGWFKSFDLIANGHTSPNQHHQHFYTTDIFRTVQIIFNTLR